MANYLYRFKKVDSPDCPRCGKKEETVLHCLIGCDATVDQRKVRAQAIGARPGSLSVFLAPGTVAESLVKYLEDIGSLRPHVKTRVEH